MGLKTKGKKTRQKPPAKASPKPRQTPKKKGKGKGDPPGTHRDGDGKLRNSKGQYASDPNTPDKPTHYAKEKSYKRAEGKKMELPPNDGHRSLSGAARVAMTIAC